MHKRLLGILASIAVIAAACGGATTSSTAPSSAPGASAPAASAPAGSAAAPSASAAGGSVDLTTTSYKATPATTQGGKIILGEWQFPASNPYYDNSATTVEASQPSMLSLWSYTPDYKFFPQLTTSVPTVANGGVTVTGAGMDVKVDLIPGAMWSDGTPITCADVEGTWKWQMDKGQVGNVQGVFGFEDISSVDGGTTSSCVIHFKKQFEGYLTLFFPLLPAKYISSIPIADAPTKMYDPTNLKAWVISGPYAPSAWTTDAEIDYKPNQQYWDTIAKTKPNVDDLVFKYYGSSDAMIAGFQNGEVDLAMNLNHSDIPKLSAIPPEEVDAIDGTTYEQNTWNRAGLVTKFGEAGATALLEALKYGYDKEAITSRIIGNTSKPECNFASPLAWFYTDTGPCYTHDVAKANSILDAAGFTKGSDGTREINGKKLNLLGCTSATREYRIQTLTLLASQLKELGINLEVFPTPSTPGLFGGWTTPADTKCNLTHGNFDVAEFAWVSSPDPSGNYLTYYSTYDPSLGDHSGANYARVKDPKVDAALDAIKTTVDLDKVKTASADFQKIYVDPANAFPEVALYPWKTVVLKNPKLMNVANNATNATNTWNISDLWLQP
jgi:peptide/nickel transport system substrate-binding protein